MKPSEGYAAFGLERAGLICGGGARCASARRLGFLRLEVVLRGEQQRAASGLKIVTFGFLAAMALSQAISTWKFVPEMMSGQICNLPTGRCGVTAMEERESKERFPTFP